MLQNAEKNLENMMLLSLGKFLGFMLAFIIPFFLSRWLSIQEYGTYKQLILLWMIFMQVQNLGMDLGLFYFVKTYPGSAPIFSINVISINTVTTLLTISALNYFSFHVANFLNNPQLTTYIPYFSFVLLFSIPAQHFENYLVSLGKIKSAFILEGVHEISKSCIIIIGFLFYNSLESVLVMLSILYFVKLSILIWFNHGLFDWVNINYASILNYMKKQILYGVPLGIARVISAIIYFDKLIISLMYSVAQFTIYSVGCFEIPFVHTVLNTIWELAALEMVAARNNNDRSYVITMMRDTIRKISILAIPIALFGIIFGNEIIIFIFSSTYKSSVPYFRLFMLTFLTNSFDCELLFRVFRENKAFLKIQAVNLCLTLLLMITLGKTYGPMGALAGKVAASSISLLIMFKKVRSILDVPLADFIPWGQIVRMLLLCLFLLSLIYIITVNINQNLMLQLSLAALLYFPSAFLIFARLGIVTETEKDYFKRKMEHLNIFVKQRIV
ncbi:MAG: oligosaccharide flippase family protein [Bdellovibrio sp.]|nr:oligosaccharide flippase family protein [Bdellovibrio sp.]